LFGVATTAVFKNELGGLMKRVCGVPVPESPLPPPFRLTVICVLRNASGGFVDAVRGVKTSLGVWTTLPVGELGGGVGVAVGPVPAPAAGEVTDGEEEGACRTRNRSASGMLTDMVGGFQRWPGSVRKPYSSKPMSDSMAARRTTNTGARCMNGR
jgi:hypothetical protein